MKIKFLFILFLGCLTFPALAQQETPKSVWIDSIYIDGDFKDWKDTLHYSFEGQGMNYAIANDNDYLYISIQVPNQAQQLKAIYSGFSITVNLDAKEKPGPTVVFPIPDISALRAMNSKEDYEKTKDRRQTGLNMIRAIYVNGFKTIVDGKISMENNYGIKTAIKIDSTDALNYEAAIRLNQLNINKDEPFALNLRINEVTTSRFTDMGNMRGSYGYPYYGRDPYDPYGRGSSPRSGTVSKSAPGVWQILKLAKK